MTELTNLKDLLFNYCERHALNLTKSDKNGLDYIISDGNINIGVVIKDWKRAMGVDVVINTEKIIQGIAGIRNCLILTNYYSDPAKALSEHTPIAIVNRRDFEEKNDAYNVGKPRNLFGL